MQWILWSTVSEEALIVSPEEAELLIPTARRIENATVHLMAYAAPITCKMLHFNDMKYYTIPTIPCHYKVPIWLPIEIGLFSGRLYFQWCEYEHILSFLGLNSTPAGNPFSPHEMRAANGVDITGQSIGPPVKISQPTFTQQPLAFLQDWISARRKTQDWSSSPMGFIVARKKLTSEHPFFSKSGLGEEAKKAVFIGETREAAVDADDDVEDADVFYDDGQPGEDDGEEDAEWDDRLEEDDESIDSEEEWHDATAE